MPLENYKDTLLGLLERKRGLEIQKQQLRNEISTIDLTLNELNLKINYILDFKNTDYSA